MSYKREALDACGGIAGGRCGDVIIQASATTLFPLLPNLTHCCDETSSLIISSHYQVCRLLIIDVGFM